MIISKCVFVILALILASMVMQFVRAKKRQKLVRKLDHSLLSVHDQQQWRSVESSFDPLFKDFRKLRIVRRNSSLLPGELKNEFDRYRNFSRVEILVTTSMVLFCVFAFYLCK